MSGVLLNEAGVERIERRRPWIFAGQIRRRPEGTPGELVPATDSRGRVRGWGFLSPSALSLRLISYEPRRPDLGALLRERLASALAWRRANRGEEEAFRLCHGEADGLPGLIVDVYGGVACIQAGIPGWRIRLEEVSAALRELLPLSATVLRNDAKPLAKEGLEPEVRVLEGNLPQGTVPVRIGGLVRSVRVLEGQKTGWYLDVRDVPALLRGRIEGGRLLDGFAYQGAFSLEALRLGAERATALEQSEAAVAAAERDRAASGLPDRIEWVGGNAFDALRRLEAARERFDAVVMDPPPFAPTRDRVEGARRGYKELALRSLKLLRSGGTLIFLSCSHAFSREDLLATLADAAADARVSFRVAREVRAAEDHPISSGLVETDYLKGFVLGVFR